MMRWKAVRSSARYLASGVARIRELASEKGDELVEFALIVPGFVMIVTGIMSFGMAFYASQQLSNATAVSVQAVVANENVVCSEVSAGCTSSEVSAKDTVDLCVLAQSTLQSELPSWNTANFEYTMVVTTSSGGSESYSDSYGGSFTCTGSTGAQAYVAPNYPLQLTVTLKYHWLPILRFAPSSNLSASQVSIAE